MDITIYIAMRLYDKEDKEYHVTIPYSLRGSLCMWKELIINWNKWSFSEKRTDRICCKLIKKL